MATERGWWRLEVNVELFDEDREHIAALIREGFTQGEICVTTDGENPDHE
jgi:hypothetical protein